MPSIALPLMAPPQLLVPAIPAAIPPVTATSALIVQELILEEPQPISPAAVPEEFDMAVLATLQPEMESPVPPVPTNTDHTV